MATSGIEKEGKGNVESRVFCLRIQHCNSNNGNAYTFLKKSLSLEHNNHYLHTCTRANISVPSRTNTVRIKVSARAHFLYFESAKEGTYWTLGDYAL